ncbi:hypothetical protein [Caulobacter sp. NIBR1757]|uniref:hypothetical protein n=1 Tax=Caulobacter sp. NIBR1757 TaxID=3016000 RepID=UPI0022F12C18|nr:hypothetical protein [Caulobacter sp. NIBR1757]WGM37880.1 hypothetical protein AMEJIAPC_00781 [Caulobacter sp. NIBR1757]
MSAFEFFFSFYGLLLGFSVAELIGGFARLIHERRRVAFGLLTPLLGLFVAIDIASFWVQAWLVFRNAPFSYALLVLGLVVAAVFYMAASMVFPRQLGARANLDSHFWEHRRWVLLGVMGANLLMVGVIVLMASRSGELAQILPPFGAARTAFFMLATLAAALLPQRRAVLTLMILLVAYQLWGVATDAVRLLHGPAWSLLGGA